MDTMATVKVASSLCGALLVFLIAKSAANGLYRVDSHGEQSYVIATADVSSDRDVPEVGFVELYQTADVEKGARVFRKCVACHKLEDGANGTGPYLLGIVGRDVAAAAGFGYSTAMAAHGGIWTPETLDGFLARPSSYLPGTSMSFAGLRKLQDRVNVIAYLESRGN